VSLSDACDERIARYRRLLNELRADDPKLGHAPGSGTPRMIDSLMQTIASLERLKAGVAR
jgi:hypothetical protein